MRLQDQFKVISRKALANLPAKTIDAMARATRELEDSGIVSRALNAGDLLPSFSLSRSGGRIIHSAELLSKGPLVISFYRGSW